MMRRTSDQPEQAVDREFVAQLAQLAKEQGGDLVGSGGLLLQLAEQVLETRLGDRDE